MEDIDGGLHPAVDGQSLDDDDDDDDDTLPGLVEICFFSPDLKVSFLSPW